MKVNWKIIVVILLDIAYNNFNRVARSCKALGARLSFLLGFFTLYELKHKNGIKAIHKL